MGGIRARISHPLPLVTSFTALVATALLVTSGTSIKPKRLGSSKDGALRESLEAQRIRDSLGMEGLKELGSLC